MAKLTEITKYKENKIRQNLRMHFDLATEEHIKKGTNWYYHVNAYCLDLQERTKNIFELETIAGVISALSPRNKWDKNLIDAEAVLNAVINNKNPSDIKVSTFNTNKYKAFDIARGDRAIGIDSRKTFSFVRNIAHLDPEKITIDVWHLRACFNKTIDSGLTPKRYDQIEKITLEEAKKVGLEGYEYQAVIWECVRDRNEF